MPFRIVQLTDLHTFRNPETLLKGVATWHFLEQVIELLQQLNPQPDAVVITGDHTHDELPETYSAIRQLLRPWLDRLWQVPGNHDDRLHLRTVFSDRISGMSDQPIRFRFEAPGWLCLGLDTHVPGSVAGSIDQEQIEWISRQLLSTPRTRCALFMHHPPTLLNSVWMDAIGLSGREMLAELCSRENRIQLICCGHVHHEFHGQLAQAAVRTTPSTGIQFAPDSDKPKFVPGQPGFRVIDLTPAGYSTEILRISESSRPEQIPS
ncbi:MAG: metallophosphoesterase [Planctomycetaceae bacterium]